MKYYVGIDEAGYGPLLGPMVVTATAFRIKDHAQCGQLWNFARRSVTRNARKAAGKVIVDDSKKVFRGPKGFSRGEETVYAFLSLTKTPRPRTLGELLDAIGAEREDAGCSYRWYDYESSPVPRVAWTNVAADRGKAVAGELSARGVEFKGIRSVVLRAGEFNRLIEETDNKSITEWKAVSKLLRAAFDKYAGEGVTVHVDRLGGRARYGKLLYETFPDAKLKIIGQAKGRSAYRLTGDNREMVVAFYTRADQSAFPVALASICSKYIRELHMDDLNEWFRSHMPGLKQTRGYVQDGRRFLAETEALRKKLEVQDHLLIRSR